MNVTLREERPADRLACARLFAAVQPLAYPGQGRPLAAAEEFEAARRDEDLWVAEVAGKIGGLVSVYRPANFVHHLYVDPGCQRRGIGQALLALALRQCGGRADLKCDEANRGAHAFYWATGFRPVGWGWSPGGAWIRFRY